MKKYLALLVIIVFGIISLTKSAIAETIVCYVKVQTGLGCYEWNQRKADNGEFPCPLDGHSCSKTSSQTSLNGNVTPTINGYSITLQLPDFEITYSNLNENPPGNYTFQAENQTFGAGEQLHISRCSAYPLLEGLDLDLEGITTDSQGYFTVEYP